MTDCSEIDSRLDAFGDGEGDAADALLVREHLDACLPCRRELKLRTRLKLRLLDAGLPGAPPSLRGRLLQGLDRADRPPRSLRLWFASAAAALVAVTALLLFPRPAPALPAIVAATSIFHDRVIAGSITPQRFSTADSMRDWFRDTLSMEVAVPDVGGGCCVDGVCPCPLPERRGDSPFILYRQGATLLSLLVVESDEPLPEIARRTLSGRLYHVFRCGENTVIACKSGTLWHLWTARLTEQKILDLVLATREGRQAFAGERLTLRGIACQACCASIESQARKVGGVEDARVDLQSMELVVTGEKVDLQKLIDALKTAGFDASRK